MFTPFTLAKRVVINFTPSQPRNQMSAIDGDDGTSHEGSRIRDQQQQWPVELTELAEPALRNALDQRLSGFAFEEIIIEFGREISGRERIDPNTEACPFKRKRFRHLDHARLRDGVGRDPA